MLSPEVRSYMRESVLQARNGSVCERAVMAVRAATGQMCDAVQNIGKGEYIKRDPASNKVYTRGPYCRSSRAYELHATDDISRSIFVKRGTILFHGFTY